ncbi:MAG TPA: hypothetical protein VIZ43_27410 [Trebonia sp.]
MGQPQTVRTAIVAPGGGYGPDGPLLMYAGLAVRRRGGTVRPIVWDFKEGADFRQQRERVVSQVEAAIDDPAVTGTTPLIVGKSLGSLSAPAVADRSLAAVWFTPLLTHEPTAAALRRATAPCLLIGGTADKFWDGSLARDISPHVVEVAGADHGMFVPGPLAASAAVLGQIISAVEDFLDRTDWP